MKVLTKLNNEENIANVGTIETHLRSQNRLIQRNRQRIKIPTA